MILLYILNIAHTKVILILLALNIDNLLHKSYSSMIFHFSKLIAAIIIDNQVEWYKTYATDSEFEISRTCLSIKHWGGSVSTINLLQCQNSKIINDNIKGLFFNLLYTHFDPGVVFSWWYIFLKVWRCTSCHTSFNLFA